MAETKPSIGEQQKAVVRGFFPWLGWVLSAVLVAFWLGTLAAKAGIA